MTSDPGARMDVPDRLRDALAGRYRLERELGAGRHGDRVSRRTT